MRIVITIIFLLITMVSFSQKTTTFTPGLNSNWSNPLNWSNGKPSAGDTAIVQVFILETSRVNDDFEVEDLYNEDGANLIIESGKSLTVNGDLYLANGSTITNDGGTLDVKGSVIKDGNSRLTVFSSIEVGGSLEF